MFNWDKKYYNAEDELGTDTPDPVVVAEPPEPEPAPRTVSVDVFQRRMDQMTAQKAVIAAERDRALLERDSLISSRQLAQGSDNPLPIMPPTKVYSEEDLARAVMYGASTASFDTACNATAEKGREVYKDFDQAVQTVNASVGQMSREFLETVLELPQPYAVLYALSKDLDKASTIVNLSPAKQAIALVKLSDQLKLDSVKKVSTAPAPGASRVGGNDSRGSSTEITTDIPLEDWIKRRNIEARKGR